MITLTRITNTESDAYRFTEELLTTAFPRDEYRDLAEQRANVTGKEHFNLMLASYNGEPVGFISYWNLGTFCYVEHLATLPALRGKGYGKSILEQLQKTAEKIVLEVEEPSDELSARRIAFYRRAGFELCSTPYQQPPYRKSDSYLPMYLMFHGWAADDTNYNTAKQAIYKNIYNL